jgi:flagellar basal-body rod protein FlgB
MFEQNSFGKTIDILHRTMDVSLLRRNVIADNVANADTPNFKRSDINFEAELKRALEANKSRKLEAKLTHERHVSFNRNVDYRNVGPRRVLDYLTTTDNNGNNVDLENESMALLQNQLRYELMTTLVANKYSQINSVLR